ncbi:6-phosphogluconolactonase [Vibrio salinus]|uniref:6-phosphogluconolactonase n=1 Tax=Vibrio salinus TaxID=2899784 RepID=UPI001E289624|nr:6-phosphogluconolactonase [Vibrio salinus]MCE0495340.1 6-phosphogluconolactonase [Vibrio salinus]
MINSNIFDTADDVVESLANDLKNYSLQNKPVHISLSGGSTPKMLFQRLAQVPYATDIHWDNLHFWWGDERCVSPEDPESNFGEADALLFRRVPVPAGNIHRIIGENKPQDEAPRYAKEMTDTIPQQNDIPIFDWILLGVGPDGHTASLFPGQTNYNDQNLTVVATHPESGQFRVSKTAKVIKAAKRISYLVLGSGKQDIIKEIHTHSAEDLPYPAAKITSENGKTEWYLDKSAAKKIS